MNQNSIRVSERERQCLKVLAERYFGEDEWYALYIRSIAEYTGLSIIQVRGQVARLPVKDSQHTNAVFSVNSTA